MRMINYISAVCQQHDTRRNLKGSENRGGHISNMSYRVFVILPFEHAASDIEVKE